MKPSLSPSCRASAEKGVTILWHELRGTPVYPVTVEKKTEYKSIGKTKTFIPPSADPTFVLAQLSKNVENACIKARRYNLRAGLLP
jgi:DNA polymerase IV